MILSRDLTNRIRFEAAATRKHHPGRGERTASLTPNGANSPLWTGRHCRPVFRVPVGFVPLISVGVSVSTSRLK